MEHYDTMHGLPLAMAYVPWQPWQNVSDGARGLSQGTIFEELIFPFEYVGPGCRNVCGRVNSRPSIVQPRYQANQRQRRRDCSCQELTRKNS